MSVRDAIAFHSLDPAAYALRRGNVARRQRPGRTRHCARARAQGRRLQRPHLFEGEAGRAGLRRSARPQSDRSRGGRSARAAAAAACQPGEFEGAVGARVLPDYFDVVDDPTQKEWRGRPLFGSYDVDREGVLPQAPHLVEKGVLKNYLLTRQPVRDIPRSNGRARLPGSLGAGAAAISNLFVSASETTPAADLKKKLIDLCQQRGKPYGIMVRKMDFPSSASARRSCATSWRRAAGRRVRSARRFSRTRYSPMAMKNWSAACASAASPANRSKISSPRATTTSLFEYMENGAPFALVGGGQFHGRSLAWSRRRSLSTTWNCIPPTRKCRSFPSCRRRIWSKH